jgi:hypothetical protein
MNPHQTQTVSRWRPHRATRRLVRVLLHQLCHTAPLDGQAIEHLPQRHGVAAETLIYLAGVARRGDMR